MCILSHDLSTPPFPSLPPIAVGASVTATPSTISVADHSRAQFVFTVRGYPLPSVDFYKGTIGDDFRITLPGVSPRVELGESNAKVSSEIQAIIDAY